MSESVNESEGRKPFESIGDLPRWQILFSIASTRAVGEEITYREAIDALGLAGGGTRENRSIAQNVMRDVVARLEKEGLRSLKTVTNFGWVVLDATGEISQVDRRLTKTRRAAGRTMRGIEAADVKRDELSQFDRERLDWTRRAAQVALTGTARRNRTMSELIKEIESKAK